MEINKDLISVIVPVYNVEKYLKQCIDSILNQTYKNIEIILINDGSTDNSGKICNELEQIDSRIKVFHKKNGGLSSARNEGVKKAKGKYLTFIDSDDDINEDYIEYLYNLIKKYKVKMSICPYKVVNIKKNKIKIFDLGQNYKEEKLTTEECLQRLLCEQGFSVSACAKLYEKTLFKHIEFPVGKLCEDNGTTYKLIMQCKNIIYGNISKYNYYKRANSIMTSKFNIKKLDLIELTEQMCQDILSVYPNLKMATDKKRNNARLSILRQMINSEDNKIIKQARKEIIKYLLQRKKQILHNKYSDKREKIAIITLSINYKLFKYIWKLYEYIR